MTSVTHFATGLIDHLGLVGIGFGVGLNGLGVPGISEVLLPLAGVDVRLGSQDLGSVLIAAFIGQFIGLMGAYLIGRYAGLEAITRYGRYILVTPHELARAQRAFERFGAPLVVIGAFVPGIQGLIGYIAGIAGYPRGRFIVFAALGKLVWIGGLVELGYLLGNNTEQLDAVIGRVGFAVGSLLIGLLIWYIYHQTRRTDETRPTKPASRE
jgi:membrane protein DedA with SNARE-associated domain